MNAKKYFIVAIVLNTVLLAFAAGFCGHLPWLSQDAEGTNGAKTTASIGAGKFRPVQEIVLPAAKIDDHKLDLSTGDPNEPEILDLKTGHFLRQESFERFNFRVPAIMTWIRSKGLDISCNIWSSGAACVTYDMIVVPVEGKCWDKITEQEIAENPALAPRPHAPRRLLILTQNRPDTYAFRTGDGTSGILRLIGLSENGRGIKIQYRLISPSKSVSSPLARCLSRTAAG